MSTTLSSAARDRLLSLGLGVVGALFSAFAWRVADDALCHQGGSALGMPAQEAWVALGGWAVLGLVGGLAFVWRALETRRRWTAFAARLEALVDGDLNCPIPMLDKTGALGRLAHAALAVRERAIAVEQLLALERGRADDAHRLNLRMQDAAQDDRRQLVATLTTLGALRMACGPAPTASAGVRPTPSTQTLAPTPIQRRDNIIALAGAISPPDPELRRLVERLGRR